MAFGLYYQCRWTLARVCRHVIQYYAESPRDVHSGSNGLLLRQFQLSWRLIYLRPGGRKQARANGESPLYVIGYVPLPTLLDRLQNDGISLVCVFNHDRAETLMMEVLSGTEVTVNVLGSVLWWPAWPRRRPYFKLSTNHCQIFWPQTKIKDVAAVGIFIVTAADINCWRILPADCISTADDTNNMTYGYSQSQLCELGNSYMAIIAMILLFYFYVEYKKCW